MERAAHAHVAPAVMMLLAAAWFVCDGIDRPLAHIVARPDDGRVTITTVAKPSGRSTTRSLALGRGEPGMGQIHYALGVAGRAGNLHLVNPGMVEGAATPVATSVTLDGTTSACRWLANTVLNGVTGRRGIGITREGGRLVYRSYDFARPGRMVRPDGVQRMTVPSLEIVGGMEERTARGRRYRFERAGWRYAVSLSRAGAVLTVRRGGRTQLAERFLGVAPAGDVTRSLTGTDG